MGKMYDLFGNIYAVFDNGKIYGRSAGMKHWYELYTAENTDEVIREAGTLIATNIQLK